jgi:hypothetical protein
MEMGEGEGSIEGQSGRALDTRRNRSCGSKGFLVIQGKE